MAAVGQARANAPDARLPVVILHQVGARHDSDLVVLALGDFEEWFGVAQAGPGVPCVAERSE